MVRNPPKHTPFPSKDQVLAFINENPGKVGTREIARAFNLKNDRRVELKRLLRELADQGQVEARRKKLHKSGGLPEVTLADITGRDSDGELIATPTEWDEDEHGPVPKIRIAMPRKARPHEVAGVAVTPEDEVVVCPYAVHRNPRHWEDPDSFRPARWSEGPAHPEAFIPFGWGPHRCIAGTLSMQLVEDILRVLDEGYRLTVTPRDTRPCIGPALAPPRFTLGLEAHGTGLSDRRERR